MVQSPQAPESFGTRSEPNSATFQLCGFEHITPPPQVLSFLIFSMRLVMPILPIRMAVSQMPCMESGKEVGAQQIHMSLSEGMTKHETTVLEESSHFHFPEIR